MTGDLHVHTRFSDGSYTVAEAVRRARYHGFSFVGVVDHDTTAGFPLAYEIGLREGVTVVPGVEISAYDFRRNRKIHLLGYNFALPAVHIEQIGEPLRSRRHRRTLGQIGILAAEGYPVSEEAVRTLAAERLSEEERAVWPGVLFKQHIMVQLIREGLTEQIYGDLYRSLFKNGGVCAGDIEYVDVFDALWAIKADGGCAVLAHPGQQDSFDLIDELAEKGLDGIEIYHPDHTADHQQAIRAAARRKSLFLTGGSDDHGTMGSAAVIGDIRAPFGALQEIMAHSHGFLTEISTKQNHSVTGI